MYALTNTYISIAWLKIVQEVAAMKNDKRRAKKARSDPHVSKVPQAAEDHQKKEVPYGVRTAVGAATGALVGGAFAGPIAAAIGGIAGLLIGFASDEDDRRNQGW